MTFRWAYIVLPVAIFLLSIVMSAYFYRLLPPLETAYHFQDGAPDKWMLGIGVVALAVIPQFVLVLFALVIILAATRLGTRLRLAENPVTGYLLVIMGNMVALIQIVLAFAMLDIFLYNAYQIHLMPLWLFALIVMILGGVVLGIFFVQAIRQSRRPPSQSLKE